jgi:hypothetical protein
MEDRPLIVWQHNHLAEARYSLTQREQKLMLYIISQISSDDLEMPEITIAIAEYARIMGLEKFSLYRQLREITTGLLTKKIEIPNHIDARGRKVTLAATWLSTAELDDEQRGFIRVTIAPVLKPYLLQVKREFFKFELQHVAKLDSSYGIRLYLLLKRWQFKGEFTLTVADFRDMLRIEGTPQYTDLRKRAIIPAVQECNAKTDLLVSCTEIKVPGSKAVGALRFVVANKEVPPPIEPVLVPMAETMDLFDEPVGRSPVSLADVVATKYGLSAVQRDQVAEFLKTRGEPYVLEKMGVTDSTRRENPAAFFMAALKKDFQPPKSAPAPPKKKAPKPSQASPPPPDDPNLRKQIANSLGGLLEQLKGGGK